MCTDCSRPGKCPHCNDTVVAHRSLLFGVVYYNRDGSDHYCYGMMFEDWIDQGGMYR